jgi:hypothetical protein
MGILALGADERVRDVRVSEDTLTVDLMDGRTISIPLRWYLRLLSGTPKELSNWKTCAAGYGIHWPNLDEDLSAEGVIARCTGTRRFSAPPNKPPQTRAKRAPRLTNIWVTYRLRGLFC